MAWCRGLADAAEPRGRIGHALASGFAVWGSALAAVGGGAAAEGSPAAAANEDAAMQHFQLGLRFYRAGDYAAALVEFEAAYGLSQHADLLLNASIACGATALDTSAQLHSGQAFTLREIDAVNTRGNALNGATIALDTLGGAALAGGALWLA